MFRGLDLDRAGQTYLAGLLIRQSPSVAGDDDSETPEHFVSNKEPGGGAPYGRLLFHSDMMWHESPFQVLTLYGVDVEQPAVPTIFANTVYAWDSLPDDLRARVDGLHALHITGQQARGGDDDEELLQPIRELEQMATTSVGHSTSAYGSDAVVRESDDDARDRRASAGRE